MFPPTIFHTEFPFLPGVTRRVAIVDDVFTRGNSAMKAVQEARTAGCEVVVVLAIVNRLQGADQLFREAGITNYQSLFTLRDFGVDPDAARQADPATCRPPSPSRS